MDKQVHDLLILQHELCKKAPELKPQIDKLVNDYFQILMIIKYPKEADDVPDNN